MPPSRRRTAAAAAASQAAASARAAAAATAAASPSPSSPSSPSSSTLIYPSGAKSYADLTSSEATLKVARHSRCYAADGDCVCSGLKPSQYHDVEANDVHTRSGEVREKQCADQWNKCGVCGHPVESHGNLYDTESDPEERIRRIKVAIRLDEMLEDQNKLLDFAYTDEHIDSLKKQLRPLDSNGTLPKRSRSPPSPQHISTPSPSKKRKLTPLQGADDSPISTPPASSHSPSSISSHRSFEDAHEEVDPHKVNGVSKVDPDAQSEPSPSDQGKGHGKHPAQSSKGVANQDITPEEAMRQAEKQAEQEQQEQKKRAQEQAVAPEASLSLVAAGVSIDPVNEQIELETAPPKRERPAVVEERTGLIEFRVVANSHLTKTSPQDLIVLTGLKNIFQRQLPKMPREYITRLVLDKNHVSMAIVKRGLQVVGGITYRPFPKRRFAEIVFCAIDSSQQVKGYGQHLMNHLKDHVKETSQVMHFLTYADNYAIGYFKKQGFTKEITLPRSVWVAYIKDYEGGTLMQCSMVPRVKYLEVHETLARQRELVLAKIRAISKSHIIHPGLDLFKRLEAQREGEPHQPRELPDIDPNADQDAYLEAVKKSFRIDPAHVPGLKESGWTPEMDVMSRRPKRGPHHALMRSILVELSGHQSAWPFAAPVNGDEVPDYYEVIKQPMDLSTMESKLENNQYKNVNELVSDAQLIFDNCRSYNPRNSPYAKCADKLEKFLKENIGMWKQSAGIL